MVGGVYSITGGEQLSQLLSSSSQPRGMQAMQATLADTWGKSHVA